LAEGAGRVNLAPMGLESGFVQSNGISLHYLAAGPGAGKPLLLVHGNSHCGGVWAPLIEDLAGLGFRAYGLDLRGHGYSDKPDDGYDWASIGADVAGAVEGLGLQDALVVAHSRGGGASLLAAAYHPGRIRGVVAFEPTTPLSRATPPGSSGPPPALRLAERTRRRRTAFPSREFLYAYYREREQFRDWREDYLRALVEHGTEEVEGGIERLCPGWVEGKLFEAMLDEGPWREAPRRDTPVLLVYGERSGRLGPGRDPAAPVTRIFPRARSHVMAGVTHFGPMEQPDEFRRIVIEFEAGL
jgi:pimeloyl-ACP methyl ester carboxylesterase